MARKPSRDMLSAGLVGSYLLASVWGFIFILALLGLLDNGNIVDFFNGAVLIIFGFLCGMVWIGGAICEGIGWIGVGRLHDDMPRAIGWLEASLPILSVLTFFVQLGSNFHADFTVIHILIIFQLLHYLLAFAWLLTCKPRARSLPASIGYALALIGGGGLYALAVARADPQVYMTTLVLVGLGGATVAHLSTGLFFASQRVLVDSINTF
ncbi:MAG: hypothetical protein JNJ59_11060 [Deltaproteobacteria bacterium]|jgi:hypothetical protein|nr:hypothetical protein [Deltaproteobacteria bacterium]